MVGGGRQATARLGKGVELQFCPARAYPHNEHMARIADEMGIMCWEEIPVYWTIQWTNAETLANAKKQLGDEIARDQNHREASSSGRWRTKRGRRSAHKKF